MESALRAMEGEAADLEVNITLAADPDLPHVLADGERMREAFVNLIKNALEAVAGQPTRELRISIQRSEEAHVEVIVEDSGCGIPDGESDRIFEPFVSSKEAGTGIGLALCRKLIREHGGDISAGRSPLGGARFRMVFPVSGT
jgi:two-component system sensor kinase FixL